MSYQTPHVMIMAGGTGGHVMPGLAIAETLKQSGVRVTWLGTRHGFEAHHVPAADIPMEIIDIEGWQQRHWRHLPQLGRRLWTAVSQARKIFKRTQPDVVLSMGGYVAGPGGLAAKWLGIPLVLHEQNAKPGLTNRWLAKWANTVMVAFPQAFQQHPKQVVTGNPVRRDLRQIPPPKLRYDTASDKPLHVLILGGSRGAHHLNTLIPAAIDHLPLDRRPRIWHQTGQADYETVKRHYAYNNVSAQVSPFIDDMAKAYQWADVVIARAGAMTVSEVAAVGVAALFVPYPNATDDHQWHNAQWLAQQQAAWVIRDDQLTAAGLKEQLNAWHDNRAALLARAEKAYALGQGHAESQMFKQLQQHWAEETVF